MAPDIRRIGRKAKELQPLNFRRLRKKRFNSLLRKKTGLRKRLKREDVEKDAEEKSRLADLLKERASSATV